MFERTWAPSQAITGHMLRKVSEHLPRHIPVLLTQVVSGLTEGLISDLAQSKSATFASQPLTVVDCTAGLGGHATELVNALGLAPESPPLRLILNDFDPANLERAAANVAAARTSGGPAVEVVSIAGNFAALPGELIRCGVKAHVVLADLGFASNQMDDASRGMSFMRDGPLDMRMDPTGPLTVAALLNSATEHELKRILWDFGEEQQAGRIARAIVADRAGMNDGRGFATTQELADLVARLLPAGFKEMTGINPATRTFQALRIAVNDELGNLDALLDGVADGAIAAKSQVPTWLAAGARVGIISFHSLEDRAVKRGFGKIVKAGLATDGKGNVDEADDAERKVNPRARSAKLRVLRLARTK